MTRKTCLLITILGSGVAAWAFDPPVAESPTEVSSTAKVALQRFNSLIGGWRGTAQLRRGSTSGAWQETGEFVWEFKPNQPAVRYIVTKGKLVADGRITWDADNKQYNLELATPEETKRNYTGVWDKDKLVFTSSVDDEGMIYRLTITPLNDKRTLVLHEKRKESSTLFSRVAEVGYTREGTRLATVGSGQPECIVTGGLGTTLVSYQGKTYYVCCSGCKQAFDDDPAGIIAEYVERKKQEQKK